ncbi:MAG: hypothetical protein GXY85_07085 [Candidatus Brocadiaceae bacterium]|nr:hypothetical protein [Candidatus Brocadiaceae bacterium]
MKHAKLLFCVVCLLMSAFAVHAQTAVVAPPRARLQLLDQAPAGSVGYLLVDMPRLLGSPLAQSLRQGMPVPVDVQKLDQFVLFVLPGAEGGPPEVSGLVKGTETIREDVAQFLTGQATTVEGMAAYALDHAAGPGESPMLVVADDTTLLFGSTQASLAKGIVAFRGQARDDLKAARQLASPYLREPIQGAFVLTDDLKAQAQADPNAPAWLAGTKGVALGVSMPAGLSINGLLELADAATAVQVAAQGAEGLNGVKAQMAQPSNFMAMMFQPFRPLIDNARIYGEGATVRLATQLSEAELTAMVAALQQMQQGMMQGGMAPGAPMPPQQ